MLSIEKEIEEAIKIWRDFPGLCVRINTTEMDILTKVTYRFNATPIKILSSQIF